MVDIIAPTDGALVFYALIGIALVGFMVFAWFKGKKEEKRTVKWIRDWEEYKS